MLMNIFANLDPVWFNLCYKNTIAVIIIPTLMTTMFWYKMSTPTTMMSPLISYITSQLKSAKLTNLKSLLWIISSLFIFTMYMNIMGMMPYLFSITSHIIMTMSLSVPLWMMLIMSSMLCSTKKTIGHMLPDSAPLWLNPFLIIIESISIIVRPLTLSFRLAANMTAGHMILCLVSSFSITPKVKLFMVITMMTSMYITFEVGICIIQAYIFCLLVSLYSNDHQ